MASRESSLLHHELAYAAAAAAAPPERSSRLSSQDHTSKSARGTQSTMAGSVIVLMKMPPSLDTLQAPGNG